MKNIFLDCTQTVRSGRFLSRNKIWATRTGPILISRQVFVLARNRYNSGSSLYFVREGSVIISSDSVQGGILFLFNFAAGRDGWVISSEKMPSGLYIAVRPEGIFLLGISQSPGPPEIYRFVMVSGYISCSLNLYAANSSHFVPFMP